MAQSVELIKASSDSLLLSLIGEHPTYGYKIIRELETRSHGYFKFREGTLYPALHRLERASLISSKWEMLPNGRRRRYYSITDKGRLRLTVEKTRWLSFLQAVNLIIQPVGL